MNFFASSSATATSKSNDLNNNSSDDATSPVIDYRQKLEDSNTIQVNNGVLLQYINSEQFSIYTNIEFLIKYAKSIGIHYILCQKLLLFPHSLIQFYIPQLIQILLTIETESMALEDAILKLSNENPHFALLSFWQLQALLGDLSNDPKSYGFEVARRNLNNLQNLLLDFSSSNSTDVKQDSKMRENLGPALVASSMVACSIGGGEKLLSNVKPLVVSQGSKEKSYVFTVAKTAFEKLSKQSKLIMKHKQKSIAKHNTHESSKNHTNSLSYDDANVILNEHVTREDLDFRKLRNGNISVNNGEEQISFDMVDQVGTEISTQVINSTKRFNQKVQQERITKLLSEKPILKNYKSESKNIPKSNHVYLNNTIEAHSMPEINVSESPNLTMSASNDPLNNNDIELKEAVDSSYLATPTFDPFEEHEERRSSLRHGANLLNVETSKLSVSMKIKLLKMNYFRCETQFVIALESISQRLGKVPKEARVSMLRAELALLNRDLPAEVDIPLMLPRNKRGKLHKLVNIVGHEAQVLNSAEKVPYLLFIEYLRDEMDFDPSSETNVELLSEKPSDGSYIFDLINVGDEKKQDIIKEGGKNDQRKHLNNNRFSIIESYNKAGGEMDLGELSMAAIESETTRDYQSSKNTRSKKSNHIRNKPSGQLDDLATQMRISAMMLSQLESSNGNSNKGNSYNNSNNAAEIAHIRSTIVQSMKQAQDQFATTKVDMLFDEDDEENDTEAGARKLENDLLTSGVIAEEVNTSSNITKTSSSYLGESWATRKERIRNSSKYGHLENWDLFSVIAKSGDDLRQEAFACQIILATSNMWLDAKLELWLKRMKILITSPTTGLVETITDAVSVHSIKKALSLQMVADGTISKEEAMTKNSQGESVGYVATLKDHFGYCFGSENSYAYKKAQYNFATSLAGYSLICYILQIKDRHNGNIMIDNEGHLVHIDFGFMLSNSPGSVGFEAAPFKLTFEYIDVLGGLEGEAYLKFKELLKDGFKVLRKNHEQIVSMCEIMQKESLQPCFQLGEQTSIQLKQRFALYLSSEEEVDRYVEDYLIGRSLGSMYTRIYDQFQLLTQGIYS